MQRVNLNNLFFWWRCHAFSLEISSEEYSTLYMNELAKNCGKLVPNGMPNDCRSSVRVRVRCFVAIGGHTWVLYGSVAEGGGRGSASGLWLEGRLCNMLNVMLGGDLDVATCV